MVKMVNGIKVFQIKSQFETWKWMIYRKLRKKELMLTPDLEPTQILVKHNCTKSGQKRQLRHLYRGRPNANYFEDKASYWKKIVNFLLIPTFGHSSIFFGSNLSKQFTFLLHPFIQLLTSDYIRLLNKHYVNGVTLCEQNQPLKCCQSPDF